MILRDPDLPPASTSSHRWTRLLLLPALIGLGAVAVFVFHLERYLTFAALVQNRAWLLKAVSANIALAVLAVGACYVAAAALSLPGAVFLTIACGFLFGPVLGTATAVVAATIGATLVFLIARTSLGEIFRARSEGALGRLRAGFQRDALNYLLFLRFVPVFPFWLVNLVAAFLEIPLRTFVIGTAVGIIPGAAVYASIGNGLGHLLDSKQAPNIQIIVSPPILLPILGLAALSLVPVIYRRFRTP